MYKDVLITPDESTTLGFNYCDFFFLNSSQSLSAMLLYRLEDCRVHFHFLKRCFWKCCQNLP